MAAEWLTKNIVIENNCCCFLPKTSFCAFLSNSVFQPFWVAITFSFFKAAASPVEYAPASL